MCHSKLLVILAFACVGSLSQQANATVVLSDDFTSSTVSTADGFRLRERTIDDGWQAAKQGGGSDWTIAGGILQNSSIVNTGPYPTYIPGEAPVAQSVSTAGLGLVDTDTILDVSFDYSVAAGDTLYITFWGHTGPFDANSSNIYANLEARYGLSNDESTSTLDTFNLLDGATTGFGQANNPLVTLAGGTSGTFSTSIDLATLGVAGVTKASDFSVFTFGVGKREDGLAGTSSIGDLVINARAVPEPSSIALLGLSVAGLALRRRR